MGPKKVQEEPKRVLLGRPGNNVKMGIVGLPNVGKSSLFNIMSKLSVAAENFPFCTIDPNVARIPVPDQRFKKLCEKYKPASEVPAMVTVTDIAGLVKGAAEGAGLGNAFLSHISAVDGIYHVLRAFDDKAVTHVEESVDPIRDLDIIHNELRKKDIAACQKFIDANASTVKNTGTSVKGKELKAEFDVISKVRDMLQDGKDVRCGIWEAKEIEVLNRHLFLTSKPVIYLVNVSKKSYINKGNKYLEKIIEWVNAQGNGDLIIPFSVAFEEEVMAQEQAGGLEAKQKFMKEAGARTAIPTITKNGYKALNMCHFFTAGKDEVRAWSIKVGCLAPQAAGTIHTDFEKGFISADVMSYDDLMELKTEAAVKAAGKLQMKGRNYVVNDGDVITFKFNT